MGFFPPDRNVYNELTAENFLLGACYADLVFLARWEETPKPCVIRGNRFFLNKNEIAMSIREFAKRWNMSVNSVQQRINDLEKRQIIKIQRNNVCNIIKVLKTSGVGGDTQNDTQNLPFCDTQKSNDNQHFISGFCGGGDTQNLPKGDTQNDTQNLPKGDTPIKNINNNNINSLSLTREQDENFYLRMQNDLATQTQWRDDVIRALGIQDVKAVESLLQEFKNEQFAKTNYHSSLSDARSHFLSWSKIQLQKSNFSSNGKTKQFNDDRSGSRGAYEPTGNENYFESF